MYWDKTAFEICDSSLKGKEKRIRSWNKSSRWSCKADIAHWLVTWIWKRYQLSFLSGRATSLTPQMDRATGGNLYLGASMRRYVVCQNLNVNCCKVYSPSLWLYLILRSQNSHIFLIISVRWGPSVPPRNYPATLVELDVYLGLSPRPPAKL